MKDQGLDDAEVINVCFAHGGLEYTLLLWTASLAFDLYYALG